MSRAAASATVWLLLAACLQGAGGTSRSPLASGGRPDTLCVPPPADRSQEVLCGPKCLWLVAHLYGLNPDLAELTRKARTDPHRGTTVHDMIATLRSLGLEARLVQTTLQTLARRRRLYILIVRERSHYVLFEKLADETVTVVDGSRRRQSPRDEFENRWDGLAIAVSRRPAPEEHRPRRAHTLLLAGALAGARGVAAVLWERRIRRAA